jgi:hypothetical protein
MINKFFRNIFFFLVLIIFQSCSSMKPMGPKISIMPAPGKPFDQFTLEDLECRKYAEQSISNSKETAGKTGVGTAIAGTALGTAAGALLGGRQGAASGAGVGLIVGSAAGSGQAGMEAQDIQWSYDNAYAQCMYAKGNQVPGYQVQPQITPPTPEKKSNSTK